MNVREFLYVCTIYDEGSITKAAAKLFLAQPSLSKYISNLEEGYGMPIFDRSTSPWGLTDFGEAYLKTARDAIKLERSLNLKIQDLQAFRTGILTLGIPQTRAALLLPDLLPEFMGRYPGIDLRIIEHSSEELEEMLLRGALDLCIYYQYKKNTMLTYHQLAEETIYLLLPEKTLNDISGIGVPHKKTGSWTTLNSEDKTTAGISKSDGSSEMLSFDRIAPKLHQNTFFLLHPGQHLRKHADRILSEYSLTPQIRICSSQLEVTARVCADGMGLTFVTQTMKSKLERDPQIPQAVYIPLPDRYSIPVVAVTRKDAYLSVPQKTLIQIASELYQQY